MNIIYDNAYRAIAAFETVLEVAVLNVNVTEEPVEIEGDDAALILQRVSSIEFFWFLSSFPGPFPAFNVA